MDAYRQCTGEHEGVRGMGKTYRVVLALNGLLIIPYEQRNRDSLHAVNCTVACKRNFVQLFIRSFHLDCRGRTLLCRQIRMRGKRIWRMLQCRFVHGDFHFFPTSYKKPFTRIPSVTLRLRNYTVESFILVGIS